MRHLLLFFCAILSTPLIAQIEGCTVAVHIDAGGGAYDYEIAWELVNWNSGDVVWDEQGGYFGLQALVPCGCYRFNMTDSYGDGWNGATYTLTDDAGNVLATGDLDNAQQGDGLTFGYDYFQIGEAYCEGFGCTAPTASNFDPGANIDDGSCEYLGCTDPAASNFDPGANIDDGSCEYLGCTHENATNYDSTATIEDGSCLYSQETVDALVESLECPPCANSDCPGDFTADGYIGVDDILSMLSLYDTSCSE